jgi:hypothetical protein
VLKGYGEIESAPTRIDGDKAIPPTEVTPLSVVPPPMSTVTLSPPSFTASHTARREHAIEEF